MQTTWTKKELYPSFELYCLPLREESRLIRYAARILSSRALWSKGDLEKTLRELARDASPAELDALDQFARINGMEVKAYLERERRYEESCRQADEQHRRYAFAGGCGGGGT